MGVAAQVCVAKTATLQALVSDPADSARLAGLRYVGVPQDRHRAPALRPRVFIPRRRQSPRDRSRHAPAHPRAGDSAGVDGRVDLRRARRAHPGRRPRRARAQAVSLPRALARDARRDEVHAHARLRPRAADASARRSSATSSRPGCRARRCWPRVVRLLETTLIRVGNEAYAARERLVRPHHAARSARGRRRRRRCASRSAARPARSTRSTCATGGWPHRAPAARDLPGQALFQYVDDERRAPDDRLRPTSTPTWARSRARISRRRTSGRGPARCWRRGRWTRCASSPARARPSATSCGRSSGWRRGSATRRPSVASRYVHPEVLQAYLDGVTIGALKERTEAR